MARRKPRNLHPVKDLDAANNALAEIAGLKRHLAALENSMNEEIDRIKAGVEAQAASAEVRLAALENGLLAFAEHNKDAVFKSKRSRELDFGIIGYRRSREIKPQPKYTLKMVLAKIKELKFKAAIRVKESVNKDELHGWPDERLALIGARRVKKDVFWYEINEQTLADTVL